MFSAAETGVGRSGSGCLMRGGCGRIDSGVETIVGVNKYQLETEEPPEILSVDNAAVYKSQVERLRDIKASRDSEAVGAALAELTASARDYDANPDRSDEGNNLLALAVAAARLRATVGEISDALEAVWGRHSPTLSTVSGAYSAEFGEVRHQLSPPRPQRLYDSVEAETVVTHTGERRDRGAAEPHQ
eukprot:SAG25_NODE_109_length_15249_cov_11.793201_16_plen_188_part_00